ncbi:hypothetical protein A9Q99_07125 [Gammaproteobacteria bacterium 45_16_T64]|nr:hypothetical protein A9Q99_07125 [Gammaproteobacteria bacterium 45_16_T64]
MKNKVTFTRNSQHGNFLPHHAQDILSTRQYLVSLLEDLQYAEETSIHHPESDALFHSLQVYQLALAQTDDPILQCAALLHDIGKSIDYPDHANVGADAIEHCFSPKICWLIRHHLDLLTHPKRTRKRWKGSARLMDLEKIRRWDLQGREVDAEVMDLTTAVDSLLRHHTIISDLSTHYE